LEIFFNAEPDTRLIFSFPVEMDECFGSLFREETSFRPSLEAALDGQGIGKLTYGGYFRYFFDLSIN
jgi:hypothetical protein